MHISGSAGFIGTFATDHPATACKAHPKCMQATWISGRAIINEYAFRLGTGHNSWTRPTLPTALNEPPEAR